MPKHEIDYVGFDGLLLVNEKWAATTCFCSRCGKGGQEPFVWRLVSEKQANLNPGAMAGNVTVHLFLCLNCGFTARGLGGFPPSWNVKDRARQIIELAFEGQ